MGDCAEYMLDCDLLNADSQKLIDRTGLPRHMARTNTEYDDVHFESALRLFPHKPNETPMTKDAIFKEVITEKLTIRIETRVELEYNEVYAVIFDRRGDELFEATYPGLNDMETIQDVYRQFRQAKLEMEQKKP